MVNKSDDEDKSEEAFCDVSSTWNFVSDSDGNMPLTHTNRQRIKAHCSSKPGGCVSSSRHPWLLITIAEFAKAEGFADTLAAVHMEEPDTRDCQCDFPT